MDMGDRIKRARTARQLSQQTLADNIGVTRSAVSQWEHGNTKNMRPENLIRLAVALRTSPEFIVFGEIDVEIAHCSFVFDGWNELPELVQANIGDLIKKLVSGERANQPAAKGVR